MSIFDVDPAKFYEMVFWICRAAAVHGFFLLLTGVFYRL